MQKIRPGVMLDCSRGAVYTVGALQTFIDVIAQMGYGQLQLYTEDVYALEGEPYFGYLRGRYSEEELRTLDAYAAEQGIELVPCIQTLAHLGGIVRWPAYGEVTDNADILLAGEEKTYELIDKMFAACARSFKSRRINIGMDEAHTVGLGKYLDRHGYCDRFSVLAEHLARVAAIAARYGFRPMMWSDMFFRLAAHGEYSVSEEMDGGRFAEVARLIPENIDLIYWDYYSRDEEHYDKMMRAHKTLKEKFLFAGGAWSWAGFAPCNAFSIAASRAALSACRKNGVGDVFFTVWKDDGAESSLFSVLPSLFAAAQYCAGNFDEEEIRSRFTEMFGIAWEDYMALDLANLSDGKEVKNACKYMLYCDPFMGMFDRTADEGQKAVFSAAKAALQKSAGHRRFGYLFKAMADLCAALEIKYDLGVRTRRLYRAHNMDGLCRLMGDYEECERRVAAFYESFRDQWMREAKGFGFERMDMRFGALLQRLKNCRRILGEYLSGERMQIEELEQEILPFGGGKDGESVYYNNWMGTASVL